MNRSLPSEQKSPSVAISNQEGVDVPIESLRVGFEANLQWLERAYGRTFDQYDLDEETSQVRDARGVKKISSYAWQGKSVDLVDVVKNDNVKSLCFFRPLDPETPFGEYEDWNDGNAISDNKLQRRVLITFWIQNIETLVGFETIDHRYTDKLKQAVLDYIKLHTFPKGVTWDLVRTWDEPKNVYKGLSFDLFRDKLLEHPCLGFVIELNFTYFEKADFC